MNYHIIPQDKFFETYIEDIYQIHQENNNVIWIRGEKGESLFFQTIRPVEYLGYNAQTYFEHLRMINPEDRLFVSWYDTFIGSIIIQSKLKASLYVYIMGGDFYAQPEWWHVRWLLDPITRRKIQKERLFPIVFPIRKPWRWYRWFSFQKQLHKQFREKLDTIRRINYLILPEHAKEEICQIRKLYPGCEAGHRIGTFNQNIDLSIAYPFRKIPEQDESLKILMGNSSDPSGNQLDAIHYLKNKVKDSFRVYCLLSYGDRNVCEWICDYGKSCLGDRFHPINKYMKRDQYLLFLNEMDIVFMYHNRQQAVGAIMTALTMGKPVFMKTQSPLFKQLSDIGIKAVYDATKMHTVNLREIICDAQKNRTDTTERLYKEYSNYARLTHLEELLRQ